MPNAQTSRQLVLASGSRYRQELLARLGIPFTVAKPDVDESPLPGESPAATAARLSYAKAAAVATTHADALIIGSDQVAELAGKPINKPLEHDRALAQLQAMRGHAVVFHSGLCLLDAASGTSDTLVIPSRVTFRNLPDDVLDRYLRREQPYDCAGSAKAEGLGIALIEKLESDDPNALIGLPLIALVGLLRRFGVEPI